MTPDKTLVLRPEPRLEAVLETIQQAEAHLNAHGVPPVDSYRLTAAIEALLHERIVHGLKDVHNPHFEVRLACKGTRTSCQVIDNGEAPHLDTDTGPIRQVLKEARLQIESTQEHGMQCLILTSDT